MVTAILLKMTLFYRDAYLTKKVQANAGKIDLQANVVEVLSQRELLTTEEQLKAYEVLQSKAAQGYRDVDGFGA